MFHAEKINIFLKGGDNLAGRKNMPSHLIEQGYGNKNWTKTEIEHKKKTEVIMDGDAIAPPETLPKKHHKKFNWLVSEFEGLGILANVDADAIARYIISDSKYWELTEAIEQMDTSDPDFNKITNIQKRYFDQSLQLAKELGLTFKSRMGLKKPETEDEGEKTMEAQLFSELINWEEGYYFQH